MRTHQLTFMERACLGKIQDYLIQRNLKLCTNPGIPNHLHRDMESFILEHGLPVRLHAATKTSMRIRGCYTNAEAVSTVDPLRYQYMEGYVHVLGKPRTSKARGYAIYRHGWVYDRFNDYHLDVTPYEDSEDYFKTKVALGFPFPRTRGLIYDLRDATEQENRDMFVDLLRDFFIANPMATVADYSVVTFSKNQRMGLTMETIEKAKSRIFCNPRSEGGSEK